MSAKNAIAAMRPYLTTLASARLRSGCQRAGMEPEDLAQETIKRALEKMDSLPARQSDRERFILKMMVNLLRDAIEAALTKKRGGGAVHSLDEMLADLSASSLRMEALVQSGPGPRTLAQRAELRQAISEAILDLTEKQRHAVELHFVAGMTIAETAAATGCSYGQTCGYIERGKEKLQERLRRLGLEP